MLAPYQGKLMDLMMSSEAPDSFDPTELPELWQSAFALVSNTEMLMQFYSIDSSYSSSSSEEEELIL